MFLFSCTTSETHTNVSHKYISHYIYLSLSLYIYTSIYIYIQWLYGQIVAGDESLCDVCLHTVSLISHTRFQISMLFLTANTNIYASQRGRKIIWLFMPSFIRVPRPGCSDVKTALNLRYTQTLAPSLHPVSLPRSHVSQRHVHQRQEVCLLYWEKRFSHPVLRGKHGGEKFPA